LSKDLYISTQSGRRRAVSYTIGQSIQTPSDVTVPTLIENEAPYVGPLAWSVSLHAFDDRVAAGAGIRYGHDLDVSFPTATVLPGRQVNPPAGSAAHSWHVFLNVLGAFVANDISIDGNTFQHSHSVPLEHWQAQTVAALSFNLYRRAFLFSATVATDRYKGQAETTRFGSLSVTYNR